MSQKTHTYGPTCLLGSPVASSGSNSGNDMPELKAHFFYSSPLSIDDPLSVVPAPAGSDFKTVKHQPRPFSAYDNKALKVAWLGLGSEKCRKRHNKGKLQKVDGKWDSDRLGSAVGTLAAKYKKQALGEGAAPNPVAAAPADLKSSGSAAIEPLTCKISKKAKLPVLSGDLTSDPSTAKTACQCNRANDIYRSSQDQFDCEYCAKSSKVTKALCCANLATGLNESRMAKPSDQTNEASDDEVVRSKINIKLTADREARQKSEAKGNPYNPLCEDPHQVPLDSEVPICCSSLEGNAGTEPEAQYPGLTPSDDTPDVNARGRQLTQESTAESKKQKSGKHTSKGKDAKHTPVDQQVFPSKGDAIDESYLSKIFYHAKQRDSSQPRILEEDMKELNSKEHKAFKKHNYSKGHQDFEKHNKLKHGGKSTGKDQKSSDKNVTAPDATEPPNSKNLLTQGGEAGTTGHPFVKLPSRDGSPQPLPSDLSSNSEGENQKPMVGQRATLPKNPSKDNEHDSTETETLHNHKCKARKNTKEYADVPVGISRLHLVSLPALRMEPIYWSPVHDVATVTHSTWFYKDTMYPVEPTVANQLEMGYRELRPWSQTWSDELNSAIDVGAAGEEKIAHCLWPKDDDHQAASENILSIDPYCAARCFHGDAAAEGTISPDDSDRSCDTKTIVKKYSNCQVIYKDSQNAFILKPSLQPSSYHGRKPLQKIKRGTTVGIHVVRGFDWKSWEKLHPLKKTTASIKAEDNVAAAAAGTDGGKGNECAACKSQDKASKVTDLVLVIHGIGQKLSERVESFHFTHAINNFRRSVNVELSNEAVQRVLRADLGGVMVLPVNWRSNLSFEDGGPMKEGDKELNSFDFSLKDITPETIPAVRNLISDVMLDIPFYMSHHKPKMIQAVISEANRVYRLWCKNNPEFHKDGRVHIIAHSLGSAMAVEVLSKQPTFISKVVFNGKKINTKHFDFNTTNLFFVGSPAAFFLLLDRGRLSPRKGQSKLGAEHGDDNDKSIVGEAGTFGCLAVDNIYNIMHYNDPIAYRLNATVDPQYAASLKIAQVPSATTGFFESIGNAMKSMTPGISAPVDLGVGQLPKPTAVTRMPSQLEMEVHDFTAEEKAEKKFFLLNDNGQVDWFLSSGAGPLEIQYLNMLGAHSSYWTSPDFVRMMVTEVGRKPGRIHALPNMKAVKIRNKS